MQVTFDLAHRNYVKTAAAMGSRELTLMEPVTLKIAAALDEDAPVAVTWTGREGETRFTRWYKGRHFKLAETEHGSDAATLLALLPPHGPHPVRGFTGGFMHYPTRQPFRSTTVGSRTSTRLADRGRSKPPRNGPTAA